MLLWVMWAGKHLILLAVIPGLVRCQQKPNVSMLPTLKQVFTGDLFYLRCMSSPHQNSVKWYLNNKEQTWTNNTWKIPAAKPNNSGSYQCESNGQKSDDLTVQVEEFLPIASLDIQTGQPVMRTDRSVTLKLEHEDGLRGWTCFVSKGLKKQRIILKLQGDDDVTLEFDSGQLSVPETIFWCTDESQDRRSNQVTVRTSEKEVSLEIYPLPAIVGEHVTLRCLVWGTDHISHTVFYRGDEVIAQGGRTTFQISNMTDSTEGSYKCNARFTYQARTSGPPYLVTSDTQHLLAASPTAAVLSTDMSCSCPLCPSNPSYRYYRRNGESWERLSSDRAPSGSGTYRCRAVWADRRTFLSKSVDVGSGIMLILVVVVMLVIAICCAGLYYVRYKRRSAAGPIYEDLPLGSQYETMAKRRGKEDEYETLHPEEAAGGGKGDEYEALKAEGMKDGVYHTLSAGGASGGEGAAVAEGGYEALKKQGMKEGVYHTLGQEASGGEGPPEASQE